MCSGAGEPAVGAENEAEQGRIEALALCLAGAKELGSALQAVLQPARNVNMVLEDFPDRDARECSVVLSRLFTKTHPNLLLLCLANDKIASSQIVFDAARESHLEEPIIAILDPAQPEQLRRLMRSGAADFCLAPLRLEDVLPRIMRWSWALPNTQALHREAQSSLGLQQLLGSSPAFLDAILQIPKLARCNATVLITGETGTGKELCARAIHCLASRADHPFVPLNCGAIPLELVENELFGHDAGAFTGAASATRGIIHGAQGGTLFLDEIDSLPLQTQVKFLRFLQDLQYRPLGASKTLLADIRIIAASNADIEAGVRAGRFREDLFYRLNLLRLKLPALRERREDISLLARHFVAKFAHNSSSPLKELSRAALEKLLAYAWPGNVRELENIIQRASVLSEHPLITCEDLCLPSAASAEEISFKVRKARAIAEFEAAYVRQMLAAHGGNISQAARAAHKDRRSFWELIHKHGIVAPGTLAPIEGRANPVFPRANLP